jgi:hypothetical protein
LIPAADMAKVAHEISLNDSFALSQSAALASDKIYGLPGVVPYAS